MLLLEPPIPVGSGITKVAREFSAKSCEAARGIRTVEGTQGARVELHDLGEVVVAKRVGAKVGVFGHEGEVRDESRRGRHGDLEVKLGWQRSRVSKVPPAERVQGKRTTRSGLQVSAKKAIKVLLDVSSVKVAC